MKKPELLIPASSLEVLKIAVMFGADAVYIGGEAFGLRAKAKNFTKEEMAEGIAFAHAHNVKVFVTANILAHNYDLDGARAYFKELKEMKPDALIVADPGMVMLAKEECPEIEIHISTQANNTNYQTFLFWYNQGIRRVVTARELSLVEIKQIRERIPEDMEIESFIHGLQKSKWGLCGAVPLRPLDVLVGHACCTASLLAGHCYTGRSALPVPSDQVAQSQAGRFSCREPRWANF